MGLRRAAEWPLNEHLKVQLPQAWGTQQGQLSHRGRGVDFPHVFAGPHAWRQGCVDHFVGNWSGQSADDIHERWQPEPRARGFLSQPPITLLMERGMRSTSVSREEDSFLKAHMKALSRDRHRERTGFAISTPQPNWKWVVVGPQLEKYSFQDLVRNGAETPNKLKHSVLLTVQFHK